MSVINQDLVYDPDILALGSDRVGLLARLVYVSALAHSHVAASDGTMPYEPVTMRTRLLPEIPTNDVELASVRARLEEKGLIVPYTSGAQRFAFIPKWWHYNTRPDKARRGAKNPLVPEGLLARFPAFASVYSALEVAKGAFRECPGTAGNVREFPVQDGPSDPDSASGSGSEPDPVPGSASPSPSTLDSSTGDRPQYGEARESPEGPILDDVEAAKEYFADQYRKRHVAAPLTMAVDIGALQELYRKRRPQARTYLADHVRHYLSDGQTHNLSILCLSFEQRYAAH